MNRALVLVSTIIISIGSLASNNNYATDARSIAMSGASITFSNAFSAFHNQAGLATLKHAELGAAYRNNFFLQQTGLKSGAFALPVKSVGVFGVSVNSFGYSQFAENKFGLAYAKSFGDVISMGLQINYLQTSFNENYGSRGVVMGEFGVLAQLNEELKLGAHIYNPTRAYLDRDVEDRLPTIIKAGIAYNFSESLLTTLEVEKDMDLKPSVKAGIEYVANEILSIRGGASSFPTKVSFGAGFKIKSLHLDIASEYQQVLGFVPAFGLRYKFNKAKKNETPVE